jgi:hypothetical protein
LDKAWYAAGIKEGMRVGEIGAGAGYLVFKLSQDRFAEDYSNGNIVDIAPDIDISCPGILPGRRQSVGIQ